MLILAIRKLGLFFQINHEKTPDLLSFLPFFASIFFHYSSTGIGDCTKARSIVGFSSNYLTNFRLLSCPRVGKSNRLIFDLIFDERR